MTVTQTSTLRGLMSSGPTLPTVSCAHTEKGAVAHNSRRAAIGAAGPTAATRLRTTGITAASTAGSASRTE